MSAPTSNVPVVSTVTWTRIAMSLPASARARLAPLTAALICSGSWQVSISIASTSPAISPAHCSASASSRGLIGDVAERRQAGARADRADHKAGAPVTGEFGDRLAGEFGGAAVQRKGAVGEPELAQGDRRAAKAIGLHRVAAGPQIGEVDLADQVRAAVAQDLGAVLVAEKIALDIEIARLRLGPHRAVAQQHPVGEVVEKMGHASQRVLAETLTRLPPDSDPEGRHPLPQCGR